MNKYKNKYVDKHIYNEISKLLAELEEMDFIYEENQEEDNNE